MADEHQKRLEDDIPSKYLDKFDSISKEAWKHEDFRKRVLEICSEHHNSKEFAKDVKEVFADLLSQESFIEKVKSLAGKEVREYVDRSRVKTIFWIAGLIVTAGIGILIQAFFKII
ncbi:MAG: hypothetical protein HYS26_01990 [Candidatus Kaiserbacteria bacterium]|nr:MAG: hypothetical protein HYS26_01990 [Candidatus Kaiserbacteria bacterium]